MGKKKKPLKVEKDKLKETIKKAKEEKEAVEKPKEAESEVTTEEKAEPKRKTSIPDIFTEENVLAEMKRLGSKNITSTMIRDAFELSKESGRGQARRMLKKLEKVGKIKIHLKEGTKRKQFLYDLENPGRKIVYNPTADRTLKRK